MILEKISSETGVPLDAMRKYIRTAKYRYKRYRIPKRQGGYRTIEHPASPLKFLQRWVVRELLDTLPVHQSATAYHAGASIKANAERHARNGFLLRIDFQNFFPSIRAEHIREYLRDACESVLLPYSDDDIEAITLIVCRHDCLTIGAPSSPFFRTPSCFASIRTGLNVRGT